MALEKVYIIKYKSFDLPREVAIELNEFGIDENCNNGHATYFDVESNSKDSSYPSINQYLLDEGVNPNTDKVLIHFTW